MATRGSSTYIWFEEERLGGGAFGDVYTARHRRRGTTAAVKVFKPILRPEHARLRTRELAFAKKLKHDNIVQVLAIEEEKASKDPVIFMELCEGGSLQSVLTEGENVYGLAEEYFLLLLTHLVAGLKYLHSQRIVHRDIKPANILIAIDEENSHIFKLTDFGGSHDLGDNEEFRSMFGTEEYLAPGMYQRALINDTRGGARNLGQGQSFDAKVDLWSVGITLYQAATGSLPFKPRLGRKDRQMMYMMISQRERGVISGTEDEQGQICWGQELPNTCLLSSDLKELLVSLLVALMDADNNPRFGLCEFFEEADQILQRQVVCVFAAMTCQHLRLYMQPNAKLPHLQERLAQITATPPGEQYMFFNHALLNDQVSAMTEVTKYPETCTDNPIILVSRQGALSESSPLVKPELPVLGSEECETLAEDARWGREASGLICFMAALLLLTRSTQAVLLVAYDALRLRILAERKQLWKLLECCQCFYGDLASRTSMWTRRTLDMLADHERCATRQCIRCDEERINQCQASLGDDLAAVVDRTRTLQEFSNAALSTPDIPTTMRDIHSQNKSVDRVNRYKESSEAMARKLQTDKNAHALSHNQQQLHKFDKLQLSQKLGKTRETYRTFVDATSAEARRLVHTLHQLVKVLREIRLIQRLLLQRLESFRTFSAELNTTMEKAEVMFASRRKAMFGKSAKPVQRTTIRSISYPGAGKNDVYSYG